MVAVLGYQIAGEFRRSYAIEIKELPSNLNTYPIRIDGKTLLIKLTHDPRDPFRASYSAAAIEAGEAGLNGRPVGGNSRRTK